MGHKKESRDHDEKEENVEDEVTQHQLSGLEKTGVTVILFL